MLRYDKALLENLTRKYGKRNIINEINESNNIDRYVCYNYKKVFKIINEYQDYKVIVDKRYSYLDNNRYTDRYRETIEDVENKIIKLFYSSYGVEVLVNHNNQTIKIREIKRTRLDDVL